MAVVDTIDCRDPVRCSRRVRQSGSLHHAKDAGCRWCSDPAILRLGPADGAMGPEWASPASSQLPAQIVDCLYPI